jgi:uncharacterized protein
MAHYIYVVKPIRKDFAERDDEEEQKIIKEHFEYLKELLDKKILLLAGPTLNKRFGVAIYEAASTEEAQKILDNDPAIVKQVFTGEIYPFRVSLLRKEK